MQVGESHADLDLRIAVQKRGLLRENDKAIIMPTNTVIVFKDEGYDLVDKHQFTLAMAEKHEFTIPDLLLLRRVKSMIREVCPFYLDGPPHLQNGVKQRDEHINAELDSRGIKPHRYSYTPPISKRLLRQICDEIEELME